MFIVEDTNQEVLTVADTDYVCRPIPSELHNNNHCEYFTSACGKVITRYRKSGKCRVLHASLKPNAAGEIREYVRLNSNRTHYVHRLVAMSWLKGWGEIDRYGGVRNVVNHVSTQTHGEGANAVRNLEVTSKEGNADHWRRYYSGECVERRINAGEATEFDEHILRICDDRLDGVHEDDLKAWYGVADLKIALAICEVLLPTTEEESN